MSEEQTKVNNELTERINNAVIADKFTLLNGGTDNIVMISGEKNGVIADLLVTIEGLETVLNDLKEDIKQASKE
jgi:hypothetical protein